MQFSKKKPKKTKTKNEKLRAKKRLSTNDFVTLKWILSEISKSTPTYHLINGQYHTRLNTSQN